MLNSVEKINIKTILDCIREGKAWSLGFGLLRTLHKLVELYNLSYHTPKDRLV